MFLRAWEANFPGHYLGGTAVVVESTPHKAKQRIIRNKAKEHGLHLKFKQIHVQEVDITQPGFLHFWDGDY